MQKQFKGFERVVGKGYSIKGKIVLTSDDYVLARMGYPVIYGIGNQKNSYYSNDKSFILSLVGSLGKTEGNPHQYEIRSWPDGRCYYHYIGVI